MYRRKIVFGFCLLLSVLGLFAQSRSFPDDLQDRGYFNRPYKRYEAEVGKCTSNGRVLLPTYLQTQVQSEASNQTAMQLVGKDSYIQWVNDEAADGLVLRFSLPDSPQGKGIKGTLALYCDGKFIQNIVLDSYWAWQYALMTGQTYPDNSPAETKFARMRFDEVRVKLSEKILQGAVFKLVKMEDNAVPYTIDFVELEPVPERVSFESIPDTNKVKYDSTAGTLDVFIANNGGRTIYIPEGKYDVVKRISILQPHTQIIGAGMWYTECYFSAPTDDKNTYNQRGFESYQSNVVLEGLYLTTVNNQRYFRNDSRYQVGKALMGSFGSKSMIRNVWAEHFECGGWIDGAQNLTISHCRFRNNYADGINLSFGSKNSKVEFCSFRNNGDDDMASWSRGEELCENITYQFCTAENNWRASSVGFFGGKGHKALNLVVLDPMEAGLRVTTDFPGREFSTEGFILFDGISVYRAGGKKGCLGFDGDYIDGSASGAIHLTSYSQYDLRGVTFSNIDLYDSKCDAIFMDCKNGKKMERLSFNNILIDGTGRFGLSFNHAIGEATFCNLKFKNMGGKVEMDTIPKYFKFTNK